MATKVFCDRCGKEGASNSFAYLCHLDFLAEGSNNIAGHVDGDGNPVSDRHVSVDLCNACYNEVVLPAVIALKKPEIQVDCKKRT